MSEDFSRGPMPDIVGLDEAEAEALLEDAGYSMRVNVRDGEQLFLTMDYNTDRINVTVDNGMITTIIGRG